ncbi:MAG: YggS family pyridoxal phosphate enzyme [Myxococcaceae bacterium]
MITKDELAANLSAVESRIAAACAKVGRPRQTVTLVAVSKKHPPELIRLAWELGHLDFGENYAQELRDKAQALSDCAGLRWHAIGPVQPKNAKYLAKSAHVFHALERLEVAQELSKRRTGGALPCLIEVNVAEEATKAGLAPDSVAPFLAQVRALPNLDVVGLTAMPPFVDDPETNRPHFLATARLATSLGLSQLSMGTTSDFEAAVACGATLIRVGTAIFGERPAAP